MRKKKHMHGKKTMHGGNGVKTRRKGVGGTQQSQKWLKVGNSSQ
jgi:hypothetical protein